VRCARAMTRSSIPLRAVPWLRAFEWRWRCMECSLALCVSQIGAVWARTLSVREKQGLVPDLQLDDSHCELKGIRVDSSRTNYNGGVRST
jgi:hypothetical protein